MRINNSKIQVFSLRLFALLIPYFVIYYPPLSEDNQSNQNKILWKFIYFGIILNCTFITFLILI
jgi:hypothetical protein